MHLINLVNYLHLSFNTIKQKVTNYYLIWIIISHFLQF